MPVQPIENNTLTGDNLEIVRYYLVNFTSTGATEEKLASARSVSAQDILDEAVGQLTMQHGRDDITVAQYARIGQLLGI